LKLLSKSRYINSSPERLAEYLLHYTDPIKQESKTIILWESQLVRLPLSIPPALLELGRGQVS